MTEGEQKEGKHVWREDGYKKPNPHFPQQELNKDLKGENRGNRKTESQACIKNMEENSRSNSYELKAFASGKWGRVGQRTCVFCQKPGRINSIHKHRAAGTEHKALRTSARAIWFQGFPEELTSDQGSEAGTWQGAFQAEGVETAQAPRAEEVWWT